MVIGPPEFQMDNEINKFENHLLMIIQFQKKTLKAKILWSQRGEGS